MELEAWLGQARGSPWTLYTYWGHLSGFYRWADRRELSYNPMVDLTRPRYPRTDPRLASEDQVAVGLALREPYRRAVLLAAFQGLRAGEIARLRREHVTADWMTLQRKGGYGQTVPTQPIVWDELAGLPPGPVVPRPTDGGHFRPAALSRALSRQLAGAGLSRITLHWYRHRFATMLLLPVELGGAGASLRVVQELLGHLSVASTQRYTWITDAQQRAALARLPVPAVG